MKLTIYIIDSKSIMTVMSDEQHHWDTRILRIEGTCCKGDLKMAWSERCTTTSAIPGSYGSQGQANEL